MRLLDKLSSWREVNELSNFLLVRTDKLAAKHSRRFWLTGHLSMIALAYVFEEDNDCLEQKRILTGTVVRVSTARLNVLLLQVEGDLGLTLSNDFLSICASFLV
jgi:hypothetical protein